MIDLTNGGMGPAQQQGGAARKATSSPAPSPDLRAANGKGMVVGAVAAADRQAQAKQQKVGAERGGVRHSHRRVSSDSGSEVEAVEAGGDELPPRKRRRPTRCGVPLCSALFERGPLECGALECSRRPASVLHLCLTFSWSARCPCVLLHRFEGCVDPSQAIKDAITEPAPTDRPSLVHVASDGSDGDYEEGETVNEDDDEPISSSGDEEEEEEGDEDEGVGIVDRGGGRGRGGREHLGGAAPLGRSSDPSPPPWQRKCKRSRTILSLIQQSDPPPAAGGSSGQQRQHGGKGQQGAITDRPASPDSPYRLRSSDDQQKKVNSVYDVARNDIISPTPEQPPMPTAVRVLQVPLVARRL